MSLRRKIIKQIGYKKKSEKFFLPLLGYNKCEYTDYLIDLSIIFNQYKFVIIFDNVDDEALSTMIYKLQNHYMFTEAQYDDNNREVCLFFNIPTEYKNDFDLFVKGKYSKLSDNYKKLLTKVYGKGTMDGVSEKTGLPNISMYDVIYPTDKNKKQLGDILNVKYSLIKEILSPPNIEFEEYKTIDELIKIYGDKEEE